MLYGDDKRVHDNQRIKADLANKRQEQIKLEKANSTPGTELKQLSATPTFRVDTILPTRTEELSEADGGLKLRPNCSLLGIAISPIWKGEGKHNDRRRWRLMLHYANHTIIGYELSRNRRGEVLCGQTLVD